MAVLEGSRHQLREAAEALGESHRGVSPQLIPTHQICQCSPRPFRAQDVVQRFRAVTLAALPASSLGATDGMERAMAAAHIHAPSPNDRREHLPNPHWHEQTLPRFVQQISGKEKAALPPSLPALVQQGQCWHPLAEGSGIPQKQQENLKFQQTCRLQPAEGLSDTQLQGKGHESS